MQIMCMTNITEEQIKEKLKEIKDPEIGIDIVSLGLIRGISIDEKSSEISGAEILMTFTSPTCPFADKLIDDIEKSLRSLGFEDARVEVTFDPPWEPPEDLRAILGI